MDMPDKIWADSVMGIWLGKAQPDRKSPLIEYTRTNIAQSLADALEKIADGNMMLIEARNYARAALANYRNGGGVMEYHAELRDWTYTENMGIGQYHGYIYGDKKGRFEDGTYVRTSQVLGLSGDVAQTKYSKYKLMPKSPQAQEE